MTLTRILFLSTALAFATPAFAVNIETDAGVLIGQACAQIWDTKDLRTLDAVTAQVLDSYSLLYADIADTSLATRDAYSIAKMNYTTAFIALTDELSSLALDTGDTALKSALEQRANYPQSTALDTLVRDAVRSGATSLEGTNAAVPANANAATVAKLRDAEWDAVRTGKAYFHEEARQVGYDQVLNAIFVCISDQQDYLKGGPAPEKVVP